MNFIIKEEVLKEKVREKQKNGYSLNFIAKRLGCSEHMIYCWMQPEDNKYHKNFKESNLVRLQELLDLLDKVDRF